MAEEKKTTAKAAPAKAPDPAPVLLSAAAAQDPAVHQVLAEIDVARQNGDDEAVRAGAKRLADLGYE